MGTNERLRYVMDRLRNVTLSIAFFIHSVYTEFKFRVDTE